MPRSEGALRAADDVGAAGRIALRDQHGTVRRLEDFRGKCLVLYFYPADDTPGCTVEGKEFRELYGSFTALNCDIVGVSVDSVESHRAFAQKHAFGFVLLSDPEGALAKAFGVFGDGYSERSTFVLNGDLRITRVFHDVTPRGHAQQVLNFVRSILESHRMLGG